VPKERALSEHDTPNGFAGQSAARADQAGADGGPIRVIVVDDDVASLRSVERILKARGFEVETATNGTDALALLPRVRADVMLLDLVMPGLSGLDVLKRIKTLGGGAEVVIMTAFSDVDAAVTAVKAGAHDFLTKPFQSPDALAHSVAKAGEHGRLVARAQRLEKELEVRERYGDIVGSSPLMREVYRTVESVAHSTSTILLQGESGTGKELVARAIHSRGPRAGKPFVPVNCSAIPETLVEAELFGHVRGAFTGAIETRLGLFEAASGGTILLDEIGDLPLHVQVKLLRTLQEGEIKRVGASESIHVDVRVIAATNLDLQQAMKDKRFREDLYYRLCVITIPLPPLRDRPDDIPLLAYHFLRKYAARAGRRVERISVEAMRALRSHSWPGNVRELENAIERSVVMSRGDVILPGDLPSSVSDTAAPSLSQNLLLDLPFADAKRKAVEQFEASYAFGALKRAGGNVSEAARQAGMDRSNFRRILRKYKGRG